MDHAGNAKKLNFNINNFSKFKNKIKYLVVDDLPKNVSNFKKNWEPAHLRDQHQRNALERGYQHHQDNDLIMISDIDEIPNPDKIKKFKNLASFQVHNYFPPPKVSFTFNLSQMI